METIQITAEQAETALKNLNVLSESIRTMEQLESKITNARSEARKIAQPILKAARQDTTVVRAERKVIDANIAVVEKPYREEADKKKATPRLTKQLETRFPYETKASALTGAALPPARAIGAPTKRNCLSTSLSRLVRFSYILMTLGSSVLCAGNGA